MRNLVVCCDGTWNTDTNKDDGELALTNVCKTFHAVDLSNQTTEHFSRYQAGVGTGGILDKVLGGAVGTGLQEDIRDCYLWLCSKYLPGDKLYLFGFSRGAFCARSLGGLICRYGIIDFDASTSDQNRAKMVQHLYQHGYKNGRELDDSIAFHSDSDQVHFVGVWDTVGALGVPDDKEVLNFFDFPDRYRFHDTKLNPKVKHSRHAVAIDEKRGSFAPTLWTNNDPNLDMKQVWFAGVHSDVGGGYKEHGLSDCALKWMLDEAQDVGLQLVPRIMHTLKPNPLDLLHDSYEGAMKALRSAPRPIPNLDVVSDDLSESVAIRRLNPDINQGVYRATRTLGHQAIDIDVYARAHWYWTGVYLDAGKTYELKATGEWMDKSIACGPQGMRDGNFHAGELIHIMGNIGGFFERIFKKVSNNAAADLYGTKRQESANWFELIAAVGNSENPKIDGSYDLLQTAVVGRHNTITPERSGYLYCYANDAWVFYGNNRGFVTVSVQEI
jgi:hypothetical protein